LLNVQLIFCADTFRQNVDFSCNSHLTSITFYLVLSHVNFPEDPNESVYVSWVLAQITSPHIQMVRIHASRALDLTDLDEIDWEVIEHALNRPNYSGLWKIIISGIWEGDLDATCIWVQKRLPTLNERIVVQVEI
jgi:hypothetical protein